jgi:hypothetical protein
MSEPAKIQLCVGDIWRKETPRQIVTRRIRRIGHSGLLYQDDAGHVWAMTISGFVRWAKSATCIGSECQERA